MTNIVAFRSADFFGNMEVQGKFDSISKLLRIQRLKEVREQERQISIKRCSSYRQCIDKRKADKTNLLRLSKREEKLNELKEMSQQWKTVSEESGLAHRHARNNQELASKKSSEKNICLEKHKIEVNRREKNALKRQQEIKLVSQREQLRQQILQNIKKDIRLSEREDAHAMGETYAARQHLLSCQRDALTRLHSVPAVYTQKKVHQGAVSIEQRFPVEVRARVIRHGVSTNDKKMVMNEACVEEGTIMRKNWQAVMREMLNKIRTRVRARVAQQTVVRQKGVQFLDSELQQLEAADKAHGRQFRLNSVLGVQPDAEEVGLQGAFERVFMSKPVRLDSAQAVYRTGSHLIHAALEEREVAGAGSWEAPLQGVAAERGPAWSAVPPHPPLFPAQPSAQSETSGSIVSEDSLRSDELDMLFRQRLYAELDESATPEGIPSISRPPPSWTMTDVTYGDTSTCNVEKRDANWKAQGGAGRDPHSIEKAMTNTGGTSAAVAALHVRVPQVAISSTAGSASNLARTGNAGPRSSASSSSAPSSPSSSVYSAPLSCCNDSAASITKLITSFEDETEDKEKGGGQPLSISVGGTNTILDSPLRHGSITPPRHSSSRSTGRSSAGRTVQPFTPPASLQSQDVRGRGGTDIMLASRGTASSSDTEQARHDRRSPLQNDGKSLFVYQSVNSAAKSDGTRSEFSVDSLPSRSGSPELGSEISKHGREAKNWTALDDSALTSSVLSEQFLVESVAVPRASPLSERNNSASNQYEQSMADSTVSSSSASSSSITSSRGSTLSSSSSSMLSYLEASPRKALLDVRTYEVAPCTNTTQTSWGEQQPVSTSPSQSLQSESMSVLSAGSAHQQQTTLKSDASSPVTTTSANIEVAAAISPAITGGLTRQQVRDVLADLNEPDSFLESDSEAKADDHEFPERSTSLSRSLEYQAMFESLEEDRIFNEVLFGRKQSYPIEEGSVEDEDGDSNCRDSEPQYQQMPSAQRDRFPIGADQLEEDSFSESDGDASSRLTEDTNELFEKWQALYQGSVRLGDQARALRDVHVASYNAAATTSTPVSDDSSRLSEKSVVPIPLSTAKIVEETARVPASPLDAFVGSPDRSRVHSERVAMRLTPSSTSSPSASVSVGSHSIDSLASRSVRSAGLELRESYDYSRADSIISALDELSSNWQQRNHDVSPASAAIGKQQPKVSVAISQPSGPPLYQSPSWLLEKRRTSQATERILSSGGERISPTHKPSITSAASVSSLSGPASIVDNISTSNATAEPAAVDMAVPGPTQAASTGRLVVHSEQRPYAHTLPLLAAKLGLDDSILSSTESVSSLEPLRNLHTSTDIQDHSLEELLNRPFNSEDEAFGAIRTEFSDLKKLLRSTAETSQTDSKTQNQRLPVAESTQQPQSSGEDTYASSKYFSVEEARNTSSSIGALSAESSFEIAQLQREVRLPLRPTSVATSTLTVHSATSVSRNNVLLEKRAPSSNTLYNQSPDETSTGLRVGHQRDSSMLSRQLEGSPGADSLSRISEYAMLSSHTLSTARSRPTNTQDDSPVHRFPSHSSRQRSPT